MITCDNVKCTTWVGGFQELSEGVDLFAKFLDILDVLIQMVFQERPNRLNVVIDTLFYMFFDVLDLVFRYGM